jgi:integrase/recombinase XerD
MEGDIHDYGRRIERARGLLEAEELGRNRELISGFLDYCEAEGLSKGRIAKYAVSLRQIAGWLGKDFDKATKQDIEDLVRRVESSDYSAATKVDYRVIVKRFYKWLKGNDEEYPEEVRWIKTTLREKDRVLPQDLLTEDEIKRLVDAADNPRDRAFIMTLYESGGRVGEVGSMRIRDVAFRKDYASVTLRGKTGTRRVPIVAAVPYLTLWIDHHPRKSDPDAPLWPKFSDGRPMTYPALAKVLKVAAERAGLKKRVTPHKLRHSRATFLASRLTEAQLCALFGWKQGSDMPSTYVHLSGRDLDDAILGVYGLRRKEKEGRAELTPKNCPRCGQPNPATSRFCRYCNMALDMQAVMEVERRRSEADELMNQVMRDRRVQRAILRFFKENMRSLRGT